MTMITAIVTSFEFVATYVQYYNEMAGINIESNLRI